MIKVICCAPNFGIILIVNDISASSMGYIQHRYRIYYFRVPKRFYADPYFIGDVMDRFLQLHNITFSQRTARDSNKNGKLDRQNGVFKANM